MAKLGYGNIGELFVYSIGKLLLEDKSTPVSQGFSPPSSVFT